MPRIIDLRLSHASSLRLGLGLSAGLLSLPMALADTTWTGATDQDWGNASNWTNGVPIDTALNGTAFINTATGNFPVFTGGAATDWDVLIGDGGNSGRLDATAGTLGIGDNNWMFVGTNGGTGTVNVTGSANLNAGAINIAAWTGGNTTGTVNVNTSGTINLTGGANRGGFLNASLLVGEGGGGAKNGTFSLENGTVNTSFGTVLAYNTPGGGTANFNLSGGTFNNTGEFQVARTGTAVVTHTGGTLNVSSWMAVGRDSGSNGTYHQSGGEVNAATGNGFAVIGSFGGSTGELNVSGGTFTSASNREFYIGEGGNGKLVLSGTGVVNATHAGEGLRLGRNNGSAGLVDLNGGTLNTTLVSRGTGSGTFNFNGGTLKAAAGSGTFMQGLTAANVKDGGARIDSNGHDITIGQNLLADGTGGLTKQGTGTLTLTGTNTYTGQTSITTGTLKLGATGSIDNSSGVALGTGGTFDVTDKTGGYAVAELTGAGNVLGTLTVSTGLAMGNSPGTVSFENLLLGAASTTAYEMAGGGSAADLGNVSGTITIGDGAVLDLVQLGTFTQGDKFTLFAYNAGSLSGLFRDTGNALLADGGYLADAGGLWQIDYDDTSAGLNGGSGDRFITVTAVPEPATAVLGSLGLLALLRRRRVR